MAHKESGLSPEKVEITKNAINLVIRSYCRESGVRNLQKHIEKVSFGFLNVFEFFCFTYFLP